MFLFLLFSFFFNRYGVIVPIFHAGIINVRHYVTASFSFCSTSYFFFVFLFTSLDNILVCHYHTISHPSFIFLFFFYHFFLLFLLHIFPSFFHCLFIFCFCFYFGFLFFFFSTSSSSLL